MPCVATRPFSASASYSFFPPAITLMLPMNAGESSRPGISTLIWFVRPMSAFGMFAMRVSFM